MNSEPPNPTDAPDAPDASAPIPAPDGAEQPSEAAGSTSTESDEAAQAEQSTGVLSTIRAALRALKPIGRGRLAKALLAISGLAIVVVIAFSAFGLWWTSQPSFCGGCHVMGPYIEAWEKSPHKDANCESCHVGPGTFGFLGGKIGSLQVVVNYFRGNYEDSSFNASVPNANCLECHEEIMERDVLTPTLKVRHREIIGAGAKCMLCHSTVAHGSTVSFGSRTEPAMNICFKCHNDKVASTKCTTCHRIPPLWPEPDSHQVATAEAASAAAEAAVDAADAAQAAQGGGG